MCMEDIRIGRTSGSRLIKIENGPNYGLVLGPNPFRTRLIFSAWDFMPDPDQQCWVTLSPDADSNSNSLGAHINLRYSPVVLRVEDYGNFLTGPIYLRVDVGNVANFSLIEVTLAATDPKQLRDL